MTVKKNKTRCSNKCIPGYVYWGIHLRSELPIPEHVKMVITKYKYEISANTVSLGSEWIIQINYQINPNDRFKWPLEIKASSK